MDISEKNLEDTIEQSLLSIAVVAPRGYRKHSSEDYDKALYL